MNNTRKMVLIPYQDGNGSEDVFSDQPKQTSVASNIMKKGNSIRKYAADRQQKLLTIILKLALHGAYDEDGKFKTSDGEVDIAPLLMQACSPGRNVRGMNEFIDMLHDAGVTPDLILNVNIRDELSKRYGRSRHVTRKSPSRHENQQQATEYPSHHDNFSSRHEDENDVHEENSVGAETDPLKRQRHISTKQSNTVNSPMDEEITREKSKRRHDDSGLPPAKQFAKDWDARDSDLSDGEP
jgi:hypothetical protein